MALRATAALPPPRASAPWQYPPTDEEQASLDAALPGLTDTTVFFIYNLVAFLGNLRRFGELLEAADPRGLVRGLTFDIPEDVAGQQQQKLGGGNVEVSYSSPCAPHIHHILSS